MDRYTLIDNHKKLALTDDAIQDMFNGYIKPREFFAEHDAVRIIAAMALIEDAIDFLETKGLLEING